MQNSSSNSDNIGGASRKSYFWTPPKAHNILGSSARRQRLTRNLLIAVLMAFILLLIGYLSYQILQSYLLTSVADDVGTLQVHYPRSLRSFSSLDFVILGMWDFPMQPYDGQWLNRARKAKSVSDGERLKELERRRNFGVEDDGDDAKNSNSDKQPSSTTDKTKSSSSTSSSPAKSRLSVAGELALHRFCSSLRRTGSTASIVLFSPDEHLYSHLKYYNGTSIWYQKPLVSRLGLYSFSSLRFTLYASFLQRYSTLFSFVMTTDVWDVVFQRDPFLYAAKKLVVDYKQQQQQGSGAAGLVDVAEAGGEASSLLESSSGEDSSVGEQRRRRMWLSGGTLGSADDESEASSSTSSDNKAQKDKEKKQELDEAKAAGAGRESQQGSAPNNNNRPDKMFHRRKKRELLEKFNKIRDDPDKVVEIATLKKELRRVGWKGELQLEETVDEEAERVKKQRQEQEEERQKKAAERKKRRASSSSSSSSDGGTSAAQSLDADLGIGRKSLIIAHEVRSFTTSDINHYWVKQCFGSRAADSLVGKTVSCSGTTIGSKATMVEYVLDMDALSRQHFFCALQGSDQGVHNYLLHTKQFQKRYIAEEADTGHILTMDSISVARFDEGRGGLLLNQFGEPYVILHQINRCYQFVHQFLRKDPSGSSSSSLDSYYNHNGNLKWLKATDLYRSCDTVLLPPWLLA